METKKSFSKAAETKSVPEILRQYKNQVHVLSLLIN